MKVLCGALVLLFCLGPLVEAQILLSTGQFNLEEEDMALRHGTLAIAVQRTHMSGHPGWGSLGYGWALNLDTRVLFGLWRGIDQEVESLSAAVMELSDWLDQVAADPGERVQRAYDLIPSLAGIEDNPWVSDPTKEKAREALASLREITDEYEAIITTRTSQLATLTAKLKELQQKQAMSTRNREANGEAGHRYMEHHTLDYGAHMVVLTGPHGLPSVMEILGTPARVPGKTLHGLDNFYPEGAKLAPSGPYIDGMLMPDGSVIVLEEDERVSVFDDRGYLVVTGHNKNFQASMVRAQYDELDNLVALVAQDGKELLRFERDESDRITHVVNALGQVVTYRYDDRDRLAQVVDEVGDTISYEYNVHDQVVWIGKPDGSSRHYRYDESGSGPGPCVWMSNEDGLVQFFEYPDPTSETTGRTRYYTYHDPLTPLDQAPYRIHTYSRTSHRDVMVESSDHLSWWYASLPNGMRGSLRPNGAYAFEAHDAWGRSIQQRDFDGTEYRWTYDEPLPDGSYTVRVNSNHGESWVDTVREGKLVERLRADGRRMTWAYDEASGVMVGHTTEEGTRYRFTWADGSLTSRAAGAKGLPQVIERDAMGNLVAVGNQRWVWRGDGLCDRIILSDGRVLVFRYSNRKDLVLEEIRHYQGQSTRELASLTATELDAMEHTVEGRQEFTYSLDHKPRSWSDTHGNRIDVSWHPSGFLSSWKAEGPDQQAVDQILEQDTHGRPLVLRSGGREVQRFAWDRLGRLSAEMISTGVWYRYFYGEDGLRTRIEVRQGDPDELTDKTWIEVPRHQVPDGALLAVVDSQGYLQKFHFSSQGTFVMDAGRDALTEKRWGRLVSYQAILEALLGGKPLGW